MKKRLLMKFLCVAMSMSMIAEAGATVFTDEISAVAQEASEFTDTAADVDTSVEVQQSVVEDVPAVEEVPTAEETPAVEDIPVVEDVPVAEDVPVVEDVPAVEDVPVVEDVPAVEDIPVVEEIPEIGSDSTIENVPETENDPTTEEIPVVEEEVLVDIFTSEAAEGDDLFISVEVDTTDIVNQEGNVYSITDWVVDENGWKLVKKVQQEETLPDTGSTAADGVQTEEAAIADQADVVVEGQIEPSYFTLTDGIVRIITMQDNTTFCADGYYLFNADGYLVTGQYNMQPGTPGYIYTAESEYLYMDDAHATLNAGIAEGTAKTPYNSNLGQLQRDYWFWNGTAFRYYDNSGKFTSVQELKEAELANGTYVGYYQINGKYYTLNSKGVPKRGSEKIREGNKQGWYFFSTKADKNGIPGSMIRNRWVTTEGKSRWRYYGDDGLRTNYKTMVSDLGGALGNYQYLLNSKGYLVKNSLGKASGIFYYGDAKGRIVKNKLVTYKGYRYYFTEDGSRATYTRGWYRVPCVKNRYYYFGKVTGRIIEKYGFYRINGDWYYFSKNGNHYVSRWTANGRYYGEDGKLYSGIREVDGVKYYFPASTAKKANGKISKNKMVKSGGVYYYATADGALLENGWIKYSDNYYYFKNYTRQANTFAKLNGVNGYLDSNGKYTTGWITINDAQNLVKYVNPTGNDFYKNTTAWINGLQYRFDANGYRVNDRTDEISGPYYVEADIVNCVMTIYNKAKTIPVKSIRISPGAYGTETPVGTYYLNRLGRWWTLMGPSYGQYCSHVVGAGQGGIIVHSVPANSMSIWSFSPSAYKLLGKPASHGCIRVCVADAKWVYDKCQGATIRIFRGNYTYKEVFRGPLGRRPLIPATGNYDPTDPAIVGNKYYNKY